MARRSSSIYDEDYIENIHRKKLKRGELLSWIIISLMPIYSIIESLIKINLPLPQILLLSYREIFLATFLLIFPLVFGSIFEYTPALSILKIIYDIKERNKEEAAEKEAIRKNHEINNENEIKYGYGIGKTAGALGTTSAMIEFLRSDLTLTSKNSIELLDYYASSSRDLANKIFTRAGIYLLVGLTIASTGLGFFYLQTISLNQQTDINTNTLFKLIPNFGILFFIEFVAFFFLRQYRSAMDEFRYYESIKRRREEIYSLIKYAQEEGKNIDPLELLKNKFFSESQTLASGETTEIIESRKLEKNDVEIVGKILDFAKSIRK